MEGRTLVTSRLHWFFASTSCFSLIYSYINVNKYYFCFLYPVKQMLCSWNCFPACWPATSLAKPLKGSFSMFLVAWHESTVCLSLVFPPWSLPNTWSFWLASKLPALAIYFTCTETVADPFNLQASSQLFPTSLRERTLIQVSPLWECSLNLFHRLDWMNIWYVFF